MHDFFADQVADDFCCCIDESNDYTPNCCGDIRVEFRNDPDNDVTIFSGESFYFKHEDY